MNAILLLSLLTPPKERERDFSSVFSPSYSSVIFILEARYSSSKTSIMPKTQSYQGHNYMVILYTRQAASPPLNQAKSYLTYGYKCFYISLFQNNCASLWSHLFSSLNTYRAP